MLSAPSAAFPGQSARRQTKVAHIGELTAAEKAGADPGMGGFEGSAEVQNDGSETQNERQRAESLRFTNKRTENLLCRTRGASGRWDSQRLSGCSVRTEQINKQLQQMMLKSGCNDFRLGGFSHLTLCHPKHYIWVEKPCSLGPRF